jgi:hypothetical protein
MSDLEAFLNFSLRLEIIQRHEESRRLSSRATELVDSQTNTGTRLSYVSDSSRLV